MKHPYMAIVVAFLPLFISCAVLTDSQITSVKNLTISADTIASSPTLIFTTLAEVRKERGIYYAASLTSSEVHSKEIQEISEAYISDLAISRKFNNYTSLLNSYIKALNSLANPERYKLFGVELRGIGRSIDSIMMYSQEFGITDEYKKGLAKLSGKYAGYITETFVKHRQAKLLKEFISESDTLVSQCIDNLVSILKEGNVELLFQNEEEGLLHNYTMYLKRMEVGGYSPNLDADRHYIELVTKLNSAKEIRSRCISGLKAFKRAHNKLPAKLRERAEIEYIYEEYLELAAISADIKN